MWMLAMMVMFGLFLRGLQTEARRALKTISHDEREADWHAERQVALAQQQARERLHAMRQEASRKEAERQARLRRARWERRCAEAIDESEIPATQRPARAQLSFAHIGDVIDEDELYGPFRLFGERIGHLGKTGGVEGEPELQHAYQDFQRGGARLPVTRERI
jgi:hypothetical protein